MDEREKRRKREERRAWEPTHTQTHTHTHTHTHNKESRTLYVLLPAISHHFSHSVFHFPVKWLVVRGATSPTLLRAKQLQCHLRPHMTGEERRGLGCSVRL